MATDQANPSAADGADRICSICGAGNSRDDTYCTGCGRVLSLEPRAVDEPPEGAVVVSGDSLDAIWRRADTVGRPRTPEPTLDAPTSRPPGSSEWSPVGHAQAGPTAPQLSPLNRLVLASERFRSFRNPNRAAIVVGLLGLAVALVLAILWQLQTDRTHHVQRSLAVTQAELEQTHTQLTKTKAHLRSVAAESERRRGVLLQTAVVLKQVDPLLSSVDGIQAQAGSMKDEGDAIASDAETLIGSMATLAEYLIRTDTAYVDYAYVTDLIDNIKTDLGGLRADESLFTGANSRYGSASAKFGNKADAFSAAVRDLQNQLTAASK
jgi:hypothetical protein